jgi:hypothetical protein
MGNALSVINALSFPPLEETIMVGILQNRPFVTFERLTNGMREGAYFLHLPL